MKIKNKRWVRAPVNMRPRLMALPLALLGLALLTTRSLAAPGDVDLSFDPGSGPDGIVYAIGVQPDGKVIIGGGFATVNGVASSGIARLNADGSTDSSFNPGSG